MHIPSEMNSESVIDSYLFSSMFAGHTTQTALKWQLQWLGQGDKREMVNCLKYTYLTHPKLIWKKKKKKKYINTDYPKSVIMENMWHPKTILLFMTQLNQPLQTQFQITTFPFPNHNLAETLWGSWNGKTDEMLVCEDKKVSIIPWSGFHAI